MDDGDKTQFKQVMNMAAKAMNKPEFDREMLQMYFGLFQDQSIEDVRMGVQKLIMSEESKWGITPALLKKSINSSRVERAKGAFDQMMIENKRDS